MNVPALIALGGNTGDVRATFVGALRALNETRGVTVTAASRAYRTPAVGANAGGEFLNAAATLETTLSAHQLLTILQRLEAEAGRERTAHWGPRSIDLDLILFGEERIAGGPLTVPHPGLAWRRFVLDPACEVAADWPAPRFATVRSLRKRLLAQPLPIAAFADAGADDLFEQMEAEFPGRVRHVSHPTVPALLFSREGNKHVSSTTAIDLPNDPAAARSLLRDVLSAALPDPEPEPIGAPLWPS